MFPVVGFISAGFLLLVAMVLALHVLAVSVFAVLLLGGCGVGFNVSSGCFSLGVDSYCLGVCCVVCWPWFVVWSSLVWPHVLLIFPCWLPWGWLSFLVMAVTVLFVPVLAVVVLAL